MPPGSSTVTAAEVPRGAPAQATSATWFGPTLTATSPDGFAVDGQARVRISARGPVLRMVATTRSACGCTAMTARSGGGAPTSATSMRARPGSTRDRRRPSRSPADR